MFANFEDVFNVILHANSFGDFFNTEPRAGLFGEKNQHLALCFNHLAGGLLASLDARLVVGIDVD